MHKHKDFNIKLNFKSSKSYIFLKASSKFTMNHIFNYFDLLYYCFIRAYVVKSKLSVETISISLWMLLYKWSPIIWNVVNEEYGLKRLWCGHKNLVPICEGRVLLECWRDISWLKPLVMWRLIYSKFRRVEMERDASLC